MALPNVLQTLGLVRYVVLTRSQKFILHSYEFLHGFSFLLFLCARFILRKSQTVVLSSVHYLADDKDVGILTEDEKL